MRRKAVEAETGFVASGRGSVARTFWALEPPASAGFSVAEAEADPDPCPKGFIRRDGGC